MNEQTSTITPYELAVLLEVSSLQTHESIEAVVSEVIEKAARLFGARYIILAEETAKDMQIIGAWGFQNRTQIDENLAKKLPSQFTFSFEKGGFLFMDLNKQITDREIRIYNIFGKNVEKALHHTKTFIEQRRTEKLLKLSEKSYKGLFNSIGDAIFIQDEHGRFLDMNEAAVKLYDFPKEHLIGKTLVFLSAPGKNISLNVEWLIRRALSGEPQRFEWWGVKRSGVVFPQEVLLSGGSYFGMEVVIATARDVSNQKTAEYALKESEEQYKSYFEKDIAGIFLSTPEGLLLDCNPAYINIFGYTSYEEILSINTEALYPSTQNRKSFLEKLEREKKLLNHELEMITKEKNTIDCIENVFGIFNESGKLVKIQGYIIDITERRRAEKELQKFMRAIEQSSTCIIITGTDGTIEYVNPFFNWSTHHLNIDIIGKNISILEPHYHKSYLYESLLKIIQSGREWHGEKLLLKKNQELFWANIVISKITNIKGEVSHFVIIAEDVSEKKKIIEATIKSEAQFRSVWENSFDGMRLTDRDGLIVNVNKAFCRLFEKRKEELIGNSFSSVYEEEERAKSVNEYRDNFAHKQIDNQFETELTLWNGKKIWVELSTSFIESEDQPPMLLSIFRNITERKKFEQELTAAKEHAEEMNKIKSYFFANMSHELRTPFVGIMGYAEVLTQLLKNSEEKEMAKTIFTSSKRLMETLNKILSVSKIESEKMEIKLNKVNVSNLIKDVHKLFKKSAEKKDLYLINNFRSKNDVIKTDEHLLREVLSNLISNAITYTKKGGVEIITEDISKTDEKYLIIKIKDTGIGIPKEKKELIWNEFRQVSEGHGRSFEGTGLGLTISKRYVELLGGQIYFESEIGKGATFTVEIPFV